MGPLHARPERRVDGKACQSELQHRALAARQERALARQALSRPALSSPELEVDLPPLGRGELGQDLLGHVAEADRPVEVDHGGTDRCWRVAHGDSVAIGWSWSKLCWASRGRGGTVAWAPRPRRR